MQRARKGHDRLIGDLHRGVSQVELGGLEPPTPCLQSDVYVCPRGADLAIRLSVSSREIPQRTPVNGTPCCLLSGVVTPARFWALRSAGVEDGPPDLGAPLALIMGLVGTDDVVLTDGAFDAEGVLGDVGGERAVGQV